MAKVGEGAANGNVLMDFAKGVVVGSNDSGAGAAQVAGDVVGALVPGLGEVKALQDIYEGTKSGNPALLIGGLVGLIPVVGAVGKAGGKLSTKAGGKIAAKAGTKATSKALAKAGTEVAEKSFKVSAMRLGQVAQRGVERTLKDPKTRDKLSKIAQQSGERALGRLVDHLTDMKAAGKAPEVHARKHTTFESARNAAFDGMGAKPGKGWHDLAVTHSDGRRDVVGRHEDGERGFRILADAATEGQEQAPLRLYWWNENGSAASKGIEFGIEECTATPEAVGRIKEAYINRDRSFRRKAT